MTHVSILSVVGKHDETDDSLITPEVLLHRKCIALKPKKNPENIVFLLKRQ